MQEVSLPARWNGSCNLTLTLVVPEKAICQFLNSTWENESIAWLHDIAADGLFDCVAVPTGAVGRRHET
jgi:hypothetical protein